MSLSEFLFGSQASTERLPTQSAGQQQLMAQLFDMLGSGGQLNEGLAASLAQLLGMAQGEGAQGDWAQPFRQQFETQTVPQLAERFAGAGALSSSGFGQALGGAGANLEAQLAGLGSQRQQQGIQSLLNMYSNLSNQALGRDQFMYRENPASEGFLPNLASKFISARWG